MCEGVSACVRVCVCVCVRKWAHVYVCVRATDWRLRVFARASVCVGGYRDDHTQCNTYDSAIGDKHTPLLDVPGVERVCGDNFSVANNRIPTPVTCSSKPDMRLNCT